MGWRDHFKCQVNYYAQGETHTWSSLLPLPQSIPLTELLIHQSDFDQITKKSKRSLTLEHRKALWVYQNTTQKIWNQLTKEFKLWIESHDPQGQIELEVFEAATPIVLKFLSQTKLKVKITVRVHKAPLAWLESEFVKTRKKNISLSLVSTPNCIWSATPQLVGKLAA